MKWSTLGAAYLLFQTRRLAQGLTGELSPPPSRHKPLKWFEGLKDRNDRRTARLGHVQGSPALNQHVSLLWHTGGVCFRDKKLFRNRICFLCWQTNSTIVAWVCFPPGETNSAQPALVCFPTRETRPCGVKFVFHAFKQTSGAQGLFVSAGAETNWTLGG